MQFPPLTSERFPQVKQYPSFTRFHLTFTAGAFIMPHSRQRPDGISPILPVPLDEGFLFEVSCDGAVAAGGMICCHEA